MPAAEAVADGTRLAEAEREAARASQVLGASGIDAERFAHKGAVNMLLSLWDPAQNQYQTSHAVERTKGKAGWYTVYVILRYCTW